MPSPPHPAAPGVPRSSAGFTLLEILVALAVLGLVMVGLSQGLRFGLLAWDRQSRAIAAQGELDAVDRLLRRLVAGMDPGSRTEPPFLLGTQDALSFTTDLGPAAGGVAEREADVMLAVEGGRLILRWRPHLHAVRLAPPPEPTVTELLRGVQGLDLAYWDGGGTPGWRGEWREADLPSLVRVRLRFAGDDARHWPDIVAAPLRERPSR